MISSFKESRAIHIAYRVYFIFLWIQYLLLGKDLYLIKTLEEALRVLHGNQLFIMRMIQITLATTKGWIEFLFLSMNQISIGIVILLILFYLYTDKHMIYISIIVPMVGLTLVLWALKSQTLIEGMGRVNVVGVGFMLASAILIFYNLYHLIKEIVFIE